ARPYDLLSVDAAFGAILAHPGQHLVRVFELRGMGMFGGEAIVNEHHPPIGPSRHLGAHVVMRLAASEHPAAAMEIDDARPQPFGIWPEDSHMHAVDRSI